MGNFDHEFGSALLTHPTFTTHCVEVVGADDLDPVGPIQVPILTARVLKLHRNVSSGRNFEHND